MLNKMTYYFNSCHMIWEIEMHNVTVDCKYAVHVLRQCFY